MKTKQLWNINRNNDFNNDVKHGILSDNFGLKVFNNRKETKYSISNISKWSIKWSFFV